MERGNVERTSAVSGDATPRGTGEWARAEFGGTARVTVVCNVSNPVASVAFAHAFDPPAGTTSVEVRVGAWT